MKFEEAIVECQKLGIQCLKVKTFGHRGTEVCLYKVSENGYEKIREYETIPIVETEMIQILREEGFKVVKIYHSCFASRNWCEVYSAKPSTRTEALEIFSEFGKEPKCLGKCTVEIPYIADIAPAIEAAKNKVAERKEENAERELLSHSQDGLTSIFEVMETSRNLEVRGWKCVWSVRTACTADRRQGHGHTYLKMFVRFPLPKKISINIPDQYKGIFIGKGGSNIKALQEKLQCKIILQ